MPTSPSSAAPDRDALKRAAAEAAAAEVQDGMTVGLGTGSTAAFAIEALIRRARDGLRITAIATSERSAAQARAGGIELVGFAGTSRLDLTIDGADQVALPGLDLIKGMGGALLREKIVADISDRLVIVVDEQKLAPALGLPVPVEVVPFGWEATARRISGLGGRPRLREAGGEPFRTDSGNIILDCDFGPIPDPADLDCRLRRLVGVVETGLFIGRTDSVHVAGPAGLRLLRPAAS